MNYTYIFYVVVPIFIFCFQTPDDKHCTIVSRDKRMPTSPELFTFSTFMEVRGSYHECGKSYRE